MNAVITEPPLAPAAQARVLMPFVVSTLIWSSTWLVIHAQLGVVPAAWSITYRFLVAGLGMAIFAAVTRQSFRLPLSAIPYVLAVAVAQFVLNYNFVYEAEAHVASGLVAVVFALLVVPNAILGRIFLGHGVSRRFLIGSAVAILGVALLFAQELQAAVARPGAVMLGIGLSLLGMLAASVANVVQASAGARRLPIVPALGWAMIVGCVIDGAYAWITAGPPVMDWRWGYVSGVLYLGLIGSMLAFALYYRVIHAIGPARAAYSNVLVPVIAMALSTIFEGYRWTGSALLGGVLVLVGLVIAIKARSPAP